MGAMTVHGKLVAIIVPVTDEQLIPLRRTRVVPQEQFAGVSADAPVMDAARFHAGVDSAMDGGLQDPYEA